MTNQSKETFVVSAKLYMYNQEECPKKKWMVMKQDFITISLNADIDQFNHLHYEQALAKPNSDWKEYTVVQDLALIILLGDDVLP